MKEVWKTSGYREAAGSVRSPCSGTPDVKTDSPRRTRIDEGGSYHPAAPSGNDFSSTTSSETHDSAVRLQGGRSKIEAQRKLPYNWETAIRQLKLWSHLPGSNRRPFDYESNALPTELR